MQIISLLVAALSLVATAVSAPAEFDERAAQATMQVSYDQTYDTKSNSLDIVACSDGENGLESLGYTTFGSLPTFPYIGGAQAIAGWNSASCGSCWQLSYKGNTINVLAIDHAKTGFNIALTAMNKLTNNQAVQLGVVQATVTQVAPSVCGL